MNSCEHFEKKSSDFAQSLFIRAVHLGSDGLRSVFTYLFIFFDVPFPVEAMPPEGTNVRISLVVFFAIGTLESMWTGFALFGF